MTHADLQRELARLGAYKGAIDGKFGPQSRAALIAALKAGPDTPLGPEDWRRAAVALGVDTPTVRAVATVEAAGAGFEAGKPKILPEPHRFHRLTGGRFGGTHPELSYAAWGARPYPRTAGERYERLARMVALDVDAGLKAVSWGAFQILGENHAACGYLTPWAMALDLSLTEGDHIDAFVAFVRAKGLDAALRRRDWAAFARGYNGPAFRANRYDEKLRAAYNRFMGTV